jgi:3-dehydroquinate dehydratase-2|tara:strand:+ start:3222 stop:3638 length:417 start_codon:yes stop_codon:yes gene_type:complete
MKVIIINGPNLNLLGKREESIYGNVSFKDYFTDLKNNFPRLELEYYQSNIEGEIINKLHEIGFSYDCILFNAGGYTHTSVAITDAIASITTDVIEVHMTNIYSREEFRKTSLLSINCKSVICGFGLESYNLALSSLKL